MTTLVEIRAIWLPAALGGHNTPPKDGFRCTLRNQRYAEDRGYEPRDVILKSVKLETENPIFFRASCVFISSSVTEKEILSDQFVELLGGWNVLAVGKIS